MVIDAHVHITENGKWFNTSHNASLGYLIESLERSSVEKAVILPIAPFISNSFIARACREHPNKLIGFASVNIHNVNADQKLEKDIRRYGLKGLKLNPRLQGFKLCDSNALSVIRKATELKIPILIDTWIKEDAEHQSLINYVAQIATTMSSVTIILAHLGGPNFNNVLQVVRKTNVYFDLSFILTHLDHKMAHKRLVYLMKHVGPHRLIYGSDSPEINLKTYFENTRELLKCTNITPKEKELIFCENICALCA